MIKFCLREDTPPTSRPYSSKKEMRGTVREAPLKLDNWPEHLRFVFDRNHPQASKVVIISPLDSHAARATGVTFIKTTKLRAQPGIPSESQALGVKYGQMLLMTTTSIERSAVKASRTHQRCWRDLTFPAKRGTKCWS